MGFLGLGNQLKTFVDFNNLWFLIYLVIIPCLILKKVESRGLFLTDYLLSEFVVFFSLLLDC